MRLEAIASRGRSPQLPKLRRRGPAYRRGRCLWRRFAAEPSP
jgi:hypothetical protein